MKNKSGKLLVSILGPTSVGKTNLSIYLAKKFDSAILSADSRQFFREMTIGTAKPSDQELNQIKHYFINSHSVSEDYNVSEFEKTAIVTLNEVFDRKKLVFMVGGSGLYLHAIWNGFDDNIPGPDELLRQELEKGFKQDGVIYLQDRWKALDPEAFNSIDIQNPHRLIRAIEISSLGGKIDDLKTNVKKDRPFKQLKIGLNMDRKELHDRINKRVDDMIENGLVDEVKNLLPFRDKNALRTVGYQELFQYFDGVYSLEEAIEKIKVNSRRYAKRQMSWFRRYDDIEWFHPDELDKIEQKIEETL